jgi:hypothetical protein
MLQQGLHRRIVTIIFVLAIAALSPLAFAQVTTTGIHGIVKDTSGAVIPKVALRLVDTEQGIERQTASGDDGSFVFVNLQAATYKLTATAQGFQVAIVGEIQVDSGRTTDIGVVLKVGSMAETVEVAASAVQLETTSNEVGTTVNSRNIATLPYTSRDALSFALLMPGAQSGSGGSTFNGLPNASMNITLDGMNNNSQRFKSGGTSFYAFAPERLDAVEEVTVSTSGLGADAGADGAMQIRFTTKRGTDKYHFHVLYQANNEDFNANTYFNILKGIHRSKTRTANYDGNMGGPLVPFSPYFKHRLFFFLNFEDQPQPGASTFSTTVLQSQALTGNFTYVGTDGQNHTANVLAAAAAAGFSSTIDATIKGILDGITATQKSAIGYLATPSTPFEQTMLWGYGTNTTNLFPTARLDYQITSKIGYHGTWNQRHQNILGTPNYPGGMSSNGAYKLDAPVTTTALDIVITPHLLNNFIFGTQSNMEYFYNPSDIHQWAPYGDRNLTLGTTPSNTTLISPLIPNITPWKRNNPVWQWTDNLTWVKGKHTITMGGSILRTSFYEQHYNSGGILNISFGVSTTDPFNNVFSNASAAATGNLPFINTSSATDIGNAKTLYALLTGRISSMSTSLNVDEVSHQYQKYSPVMDRFGYITGGLYVQDSFRLRSNLTMNYGMRWEFTGALHSLNGIDNEPSNLYGPSNAPFQPGVLNSSFNPVLGNPSYGYSRDMINPAPNLGVSWSPEANDGLLGKLIGHGKTVISSSYGLTYYNEGINSISNTMTGNPGSTQSQSAAAAISANPGSLNLTTPTPAFSVSPAAFSSQLPMSPYPLNGGTTFSYINPNLKTPYVQSWNFRIQRELAKGLVLDIRYVGTKATHVWHYQNVNEVNIIENGFLKEFQNAQSNLAIANGLTVAQLTALPAPALKVSNFASTGLAGQVPLPIFTAAFGANGSNAALAASSGFGNSTFITNLEQGAAGTLASSLATTSSATYYCRLVGSNFAPCAAAGFGYTANNGYAQNFWRGNPYSNTVNYQDDNGNNNYNGLQIELRRAFSHGLMLDTHYTWSKTLGSVSNSSDQTGTYTFWTLRNGHMNYGPTPFDHRHTFISYLTYDLPFGRGKWVNMDNKILNGILGNWTVASTNQVISGAPTLLLGGGSSVGGGNGRSVFNDLGADGGVAFGNGMNVNQLLQSTASQATGNYDTTCQCIRTNVSGIVQANGAVNPAYYAPAQVAGQIGGRIFYPGKTSISLNMALTKRFRINERVALSFYGEASNWLNHPFFSQGSLTITGTTFGQITGASGNRTILMRGALDF